MNLPALIGQVLLWLGFLSGSLATVFQFKNPENEWATVNWPWFIASVIVGFIGIALFRSSKTAIGGNEEKIRASFDSLLPALQRLSDSAHELVGKLDEFAPSEVTKWIDDRMADDFRQFADARESMIASRSMSFYADVMTQFASAERTVNRAWSAAADGYLDETRDCLVRASELLNNATQLLDSHSK